MAFEGNNPGRNNLGGHQATIVNIDGQPKESFPSPENLSEKLLNRREQRLKGRIDRRVKVKVRKIKSHVVTIMMPEDEILRQEDDISLLKKEMRLYQSAQVYTSLEIVAYDALNQVGVSDDYCKKLFMTIADGEQASEGGTLEDKQLDDKEFGKMIANRDSRKLLKMRSAVGALFRHKQYCDQEEIEIVESLIGDNNIKGIDILKEVMRARQVSIGLMALQIEWLKNAQSLETKQMADRQVEGALKEQSLAVLQNVLQEQSEISNPKQEVEEDFLLKGWNLSITDSPWSSEQNHLINIPTNSRKDSLDAITKFTQSKVSIKPKSILSALEFYLSKDVVQKALATRIEYSNDKWIKLKRGGYRIPLLIPNPDQKLAIFFVGARGAVYKDM